MHATFAFCGIVLAGWVSPEFARTDHTIAGQFVRAATSRPQPPRPRLSYSQPAGTRPARAMNEGAMRRARMPMAPTDPRTYSIGDLPLPPTMNDSGMLPGSSVAGGGLRRDLIAPAESQPSFQPKGIRQLQAGADHESLPVAGQHHRQRHGQSLYGLRPPGRAAATGPSAI